ncbi:MAG: YggS family pyridoxal phosphate-dependent enzyme [Actinobacteria bacterium]|nr:YggS family pyridoxal phosphate-dependent enzyme [Actinomycetota bacterium]
MTVNYKNNIEKLSQEIEASCRFAGRKKEEVLLIAASKYADAKQIKEVHGLGINDFGENRAEDFEEKYHSVGNGITWHFIGHLQRRKVKTVVPLAEYIHSVDSDSLVAKINSEALKINKIQKILVEVNISSETTKFGIEPGGIWEILNEIKNCSNIKFCGLMTMAPLTDDVNTIRETFYGLKKLLEKIRQNASFKTVKELSMGMSNDFKTAIEQGATMLRIGSLIFL